MTGTCAGTRFECGPVVELAGGFSYTEGPIYCSDGSVIVCDIGNGTEGGLVRVSPGGTKSTLATVAGGPNGAAVGPDGAIYVCNDGGLVMIAAGNVKVAVGQTPAPQPAGCIQRVDPKTGAVSTLYKSFPGPNGTSLSLSSPDDIVFDRAGGFWFSDWGAVHLDQRVRTITGVYYATPDGSSIAEKIFPLAAPNGIDLSPAEDRLYVAETYSRRVLFFDLVAPGQIRKNPKTASAEGSYLLTSKLPGEGILDSMKVDAEGNVYVVTMLPHGNDPATNGGISVVSPQGELLDFIELKQPGAFLPLPSNLCFGGDDMRTAYITTGGSGSLLSMRLPIPGRKLAYNF